MLTPEAIEKILELKKEDVIEVDGRSYATCELRAVRDPQIPNLCLHTLTGLVDYINSGMDKEHPSYSTRVIQIVSPVDVKVITPPAGPFRDRQVFASVGAALYSGKDMIGNFIPVEEFIIWLQGSFLRTPARDELLKLVSNIKDEAIRTSNDDGFSQQVTVKAGAALVRTAEIKNPFNLKPYRTFREIDQPASDFVLRVRPGISCALISTDGDQWKLDAIQGIRDYLNTELPDETILA
ncbi:MAG: hypothetical protein KJ970_13315 [Candidatus Eisenbacteria bacterium]|uniref:Uncharacterized protein n=1 Tax=Eiseniibacteriota bacterium TaxID=2212470 RepID=A0A948RVP7_UNCEI|nr:hypothetical protein [Candidatus Eisenbacteria bacterium]MBU1947895.1 hypothetical protein [Candidatus Eisenbacteria bacterium]MBU2691893.1 hypothetical protein [Candidatus Eisenbacteria bacterium]